MPRVYAKLINDDPTPAALGDAAVSAAKPR